jgi:HEPN domain-containing protein
MDPKLELARGLLTKAQGDLEIAPVLSQTRPARGWGIGFHLQQAVAKALKSVLCAHGIPYPRTHSILALLDLLAEHGWAPPLECNPLAALTPFGTLLRYNDDSDTGDADVPGDAGWPGVLSTAAGAVHWATGMVDSIST